MKKAIETAVLILLFTMSLHAQIVTMQPGDIVEVTWCDHGDDGIRYKHPEIWFKVYKLNKDKAIEKVFIVPDTVLTDIKLEESCYFYVTAFKKITDIESGPSDTIFVKVDTSSIFPVYFTGRDILQNKMCVGLTSLWPDKDSDILGLWGHIRPVTINVAFTAPEDAEYIISVKADGVLTMTCEENEIVLNTNKEMQRIKWFFKAGLRNLRIYTDHLAHLYWIKIESSETETLRPPASIFVRKKK